jgi:hypothetical protein
VNVAESISGVADVHSQIHARRPHERGPIDEAREREDEIARR